jgi:hypothetical protein
MTIYNMNETKPTPSPPSVSGVIKAARNLLADAKGRARTGVHKNIHTVSSYHVAALESALSK